MSGMEGGTPDAGADRRSDRQITDFRIGGSVGQDVRVGDVTGAPNRSGGGGRGGDRGSGSSDKSSSIARSPESGKVANLFNVLAARLDREPGDSKSQRSRPEKPGPAGASLDVAGLGHGSSSRETANRFNEQATQVLKGGDLAQVARGLDSGTPKGADGKAHSGPKKTAEGSPAADKPATGEKGKPPESGPDLKDRGPQVISFDRRGTALEQLRNLQRGKSRGPVNYIALALERQQKDKNRPDLGGGLSSRGLDLPKSGGGGRHTWERRPMSREAPKDASKEDKWEQNRNAIKKYKARMAEALRMMGAKRIPEQYR